MKRKFVVIGVFACLSMLTSVSALAGTKAENKILARGRYLVATSGCNDCHTPGYPEAGGKIEVSKWLVGSSVGFQGRWGTTYPVNLRLLVHGLSKKQWLQLAHKKMRPPMPWFNLQTMTRSDLVAIYTFIPHLGPAGKPAPAYAPPGQVVNTPFIYFVPKNLSKTARAGN